MRGHSVTECTFLYMFVSGCSVHNFGCMVSGSVDMVECLKCVHTRHTVIHDSFCRERKWWYWWCLCCYQLE